MHAKPCILINTSGYWDKLLAFADSVVEAGFLPPRSRAFMQVAASSQVAIDMVIAQLRPTDN
jgi:predicted Rossmann-fold nucleotide-binding protein